MSSIDNGGAIAIKGFNYQKACIIYVIVRNYRKNNFKIIPEAQDDFEVHFDNHSVYVQVKGTKKLSISNMTSNSMTTKLKYIGFKGNMPNVTVCVKVMGKRNLNKKNNYKKKLSIIEKNLVPGKDNDKRKIFLFDLIPSVKDKLIESEDSIDLVPTIYSFSDTQKSEIAKKLKLEGSKLSRLENQYIYITPFENKMTSSIPAIYGEMVLQGLVVTREKANEIFRELTFLIDQKSELLIKDISKDIKKKEITFDVIEPLFLTSKELDSFDEILKNLGFNTMFKNKVKKSKLFLHQKRRYFKSEVIRELDADEILQSRNDSIAIESILSVINTKDSEIDLAESYALAIECFCELGEKNHDN